MSTLALRLNTLKLAPGGEIGLSQMADEQLLMQVCDQNVQALEVLYNRYAPRALGLALKIVKDRDLAEQVIQDAFWRVWRKAAQYEQKKGRFSTWLFTIVHNLAIDQIRRRRGDISLDEPDQAETIEAQLGGEDMDDTVVRDIDGAQVRTAIQTLPQAQRQVIELVYFEGMSHRQVAKKLSAPLGTIHTRARLGLEKLRLIMPR
ncbi:MAG: sigma-70 family RNA polymerase sigma factor [Anaerolineae bacterium]